MTNLIAQTTDGGWTARLGTRPWMVALGVAALLCYLVGAAYHATTWLASTPPAASVRAAYQVVILLGYLALWLLFSLLLRRRRAAPPKALWTTLLVGLLIIGLGYLVTRLGDPVNLDLNPVIDVLGFDYTTGVPLTLATVVKTNLLSLLDAAFAFVLLLRLRDLVLVKRTRTTLRNWNLMLVLMAGAALFAFMRPPRADLGALQILAMLPAIVFMVINSLRLSWIVYLSFREKMASIGLVLVLLVMLLGIVPTEESLLPGLELIPDSYNYLKHYSFPLTVFCMEAIIFGILFCTTALLSLLFHLPTTSDFQQKAGEVAAMHSLAHLVNQVFDSERLFATICASPVEAGSGDAAWLAVADPQSGSLRPRLATTHGIDRAQVGALVDVDALYDDVAGGRAPIRLDEAPADHRVHARPGQGLGSLLVVPLIARDEVLGALFVSKEVTHGFETDDVDAIAVFAAQAALAIVNAQLFEERLEKERLAREISIAREVQRKLLPQKLPKMAGVALAASSVSAQEVGGDYYDFVRLDDDRLALIIADVSGKGTSAAFYMAEMQGIFHAVSRIAPDPADFLEHANTVLAASLEKNVFISVIYGVLDLSEETFVLARAGHCPAATINVGGEARYLRSRGLGLGLDRGDLFRRTLAEERICLQPGDVFVMYTDGVVESRSPEGEEYGYDRLLHVLREHRHEDADELHRLLLDDLHGFIGSHDYDDDLTLVVLKWHGIDLPAHAASNHRSQPEPRAVESSQPT